MSDNNGGGASALMVAAMILYIVAIGWLIKIATFLFGWGHKRIAQRRGWILSVVSMTFGANILVFLALATALVVFADGGRGQAASMQALFEAYWWVYPLTLFVLITGGIWDATAGRDALARQTGKPIEELTGE